MTVLAGSRQKSPCWVTARDGLLAPHPFPHPFHMNTACLPPKASGLQKLPQEAEVQDLDLVFQVHADDAVLTINT